MITAYRLALPERLPRYFGETYPLGERLIIAAPAPNAAFTYSRGFCLLKPNEISKVIVSNADLKIYWETGTETPIAFALLVYDPEQFSLLFNIPADAQVGRMYGVFTDTDGASYQMDPVQVVVRR